MSKLSELLNPSDQQENQSPVATTQPVELRGGPGNYQTGGHNVRPASIYTGGSPRRPSITSPLDALAEAATNSAPLPSPSRPNASSMRYDHQYSSIPASSSRPTSSHTSPPKAFELPPVPHQTGAQTSPGLEQYHHSSSNAVRARRVSEIANGASQVLAPLRTLQDEIVPPTTGTDFQFPKGATLTRMLVNSIFLRIRHISSRKDRYRNP